jgi:catechol 2,3-dioxygenase-like lactoylglutathione lyase family enzyme
VSVRRVGRGLFIGYFSSGRDCLTTVKTYQSRRCYVDEPYILRCDPHGSSAYARDVSLSLRWIDVLAADPERSAQFWGDLLGWERDGTSLAPDPATPFGISFVATDTPVHLPTQIHWHLTSNDATQEQTVARAMALGASHIDVGQQPDEDHVVLADPDGVAFCVIEDGNGWLAGTPLLGEFACDGTRDVGVFWSEALGWPLVHDEDGETAIQPPGGGPKIAWGGPPLDERVGRNRMHLVLVADDLDDLDAEVERLTGLGAVVVQRTDDGVEMADPDGNEFWVRP